ncbi:hypothetical protein ACO7_230132 [Thiomonas arsenitoxydans]|nr:hypothetical protein THICB6_110069 [Thiomonas arsenitoxydans]CQR31383.1 hypothetical protein ACO7_230132 [Thiomonas arsenitoxydans]
MPVKTTTEIDSPQNGIQTHLTRPRNGSFSWQEIPRLQKNNVIVLTHEFNRFSHRVSKMTSSFPLLQPP